MQARLRVLVIEDDLDTSVTTVELLRALGCDAEPVLNGGSGIAAARTFRPDFILLDVGLPDSSGWEVAAAIKAEHPSVRIFAVTGRADDESRRLSFAAGCEAHLVKPVDPAIFQALFATPRPAQAAAQRDALLPEMGRSGPPV
jgi:CheY-like chemotaxis protein